MDAHTAKLDEHDDVRTKAWCEHGREELLEHIRTQTGAGDALLEWLDAEWTLLFRVGKLLEESFGPGGFSWVDLDFESLMGAVARAQLRESLFQSSCQHLLDPARRIEFLDRLSTGRA